MIIQEEYRRRYLPARPRRPRDKGKVEAGVRFAQSCILGRLGRQTFFSLAEVTQAITGRALSFGRAREIGVLAQAVAQALDLDNDGVVQQVVQQGGGEDGIADDLPHSPKSRLELRSWRPSRGGR